MLWMGYKADMCKLFTYRVQYIGAHELEPYNKLKYNKRNGCNQGRVQSWGMCFDYTPLFILSSTFYFCFEMHGTDVGC